MTAARHQIAVAVLTHAHQEAPEEIIALIPLRKEPTTGQTVLPPPPSSHRQQYS